MYRFALPVFKNRDYDRRKILICLFYTIVIIYMIGAILVITFCRFNDSYCWKNQNRNRDRYRNRKNMGLGHEKLMVPSHSIPILIAISIPMQPSPNKRMHRALIHRIGVS